MPVINRFVDHDELYERTLRSGITPIIINDLPNTTEADKEHIRNLTLTQLTSDTINTIPSCKCGATRGKYAIGKVCPMPTCGDVVKTNIEESSRSLLWVRAPEGVDALVSPLVWKMLSLYFTKNNHNAINWLTDSHYTSASRTPVEIDKLQRKGHERDLNYFIRNFDIIIEDLIDIFPEKPNRRYAKLRQFLDEHRDMIFSQFQPLPSRNLFITDKTNLGIYMEDAIKDALDTIYHFVSIDLEFYDRSPKVITNRTARFLARQAEFYPDYITTNFQPKPGHYRRYMLGARNIFSARGVITSVTGDHKFDEVGVPWRIAVPMYSHDIMGKLMRYGYNFNEALGYLMRKVVVYDKLIHRFLSEVFDESPGGRGPSMILHRNPTLQQGSMQRFFAYLKTDPTDPSIGMSILTVVPPNADRLAF